MNRKHFDKMNNEDELNLKKNDSKNVAPKSKRKAADTLVQEFSKPQMKSYQFYIMLTKPNVELIWCEEYAGQDAYTHPIYEHIMNRTTWMKRFKFVASYSWRESKNADNALYNVVPSRQNNTLYPRRYYMRIVDENESTTQSRYDILLECMNVSTVLVYMILFGSKCICLT